MTSTLVRMFSSRSLVAIAGCALVGAPAIAGPLPVTTQISQYLIIGTGNAQTGNTIDVQKTELGADQYFVSGFDPNLADVFDAPGKRRWNSTTNRTYDNKGLPPSAPVFQGIDYSGHMAVTSPTGRFTLSNTSVYANGFAARCASVNGINTNQCRDDFASPSSSPWITSPLVNNGDIGTGVGVVGSYNHAPLISELIAARNFIAGLTAEVTLTSNLENGFSSFNIDSADTNNDGLAVIDIERGGNDWLLNNYDWILNGDGSTFAIFRVRGNTNMLMSNSSIALGPGGIGNGSATVAPDELGALFVQYEEPKGNTDKVFNFQNVILNGVGFWDLNAFRVGKDGQTQYLDSVNTELNVQNGQGCSQFISSSVIFTSSVRWNRCDIGTQQVPEPGALSLLALGLLGLGAMRRRKTH